MSELRIGLVTPAYAEEQMLPRRAASIAGRTAPPVVRATVDDASPDTRTRPPGYAADQRSPAAALNTGIRLIEDAGVVYHVIMKVDADLELEPGFLAAIGDARRQPASAPPSRWAQPRTWRPPSYGPVWPAASLGPSA